MESKKRTKNKKKKLKKGHNEILCRTDTDSQTLKKSYGFQRRQVGVWGDVPRVWEGNAVNIWS